MLNKQFLTECVQKLSEKLPQGMKPLQEDVHQHWQNLVANVLSELNLVTMEEFQVQKKVLARTREKLEALEARVRELEAQQSSTLD